MTIPTSKISEKLQPSQGSDHSSLSENGQGYDRESSEFFRNLEAGPVSQKQRDQNWSQDEAVEIPGLNKAKVKQAELILFTTQLSVMLDTGVVLSDAMDAIAEQAENGTFKSIIADIAEKVKGGENFSSALAEYPRAFNEMFISMVKASEASGKMAEMLNVLSGYLEFESDIRKRIKGALTYPFIMALMAVAATGTLMFFVLPRFMKIYETRGAALPKLTQVIVSFSKLLGNL